MDADVRFGQIALAHKLITKKQHDQAWKTLKELRRKAKGKKGKKKGGPRLVDVLVQREFLSGRQAKQIENARVYQQARLEDKLYARIVLKSKFCKPKQIEKALSAQRKAYLEGEGTLRISEFLLDKNWLTEEQDEAIQAALGKLDVEQYMGAKAKSAEVDLDVSDSSDDDLGSDEGSAVELDSDDETDSGSDEGVEEIDLDSVEEGSGSGLDDPKSMDELDSEIDGALSGISESELDLDEDGDGDEDEDEDGEGSDDPPPHGLSSDDLGSDLDLDDSEGELSDDIGSGIDLDSEEVAAASGRRRKVKAAESEDLSGSGSGSDFDLSDVDLDD